MELLKKTGWWLVVEPTRLKKHARQNGSSSPILGVNIKKIVETTNRRIKLQLLQSAELTNMIDKMFLRASSLPGYPMIGRFFWKLQKAPSLPTPLPQYH